MRWENGSPYVNALLTASLATASEHSMPLRQSEILKYKMHVLWHFDEEESATSTKAYRKKAYEGYNQRV